jgi:hypothetical protein
MTIDGAMVEPILGKEYQEHGHMARGGHGLPKLSLGPSMLNYSTPCGLGCLEVAKTFLELKYAPNYFPMNIKDLNFKS